MTQQVQIADDDIRLVDLWRAIARRKWVVLVSWLISGVVLGFYLAFAQPTYRSEARLLPPAEKDIQELLISLPGVIDLNYTTDQIYRAFVRNLRSPGLQKAFFKEFGLLDRIIAKSKRGRVNPDKIFEESFHRKLVLRRNRKDDEIVEVSLEHTDANLAAKWLSEYVQFANDKTVTRFYQDVDTAIRARVERARALLASKRDVSVERRHDAVIRLEEALQIARNLGIVEPQMVAVLPGPPEASLMIDMTTAPLYLRGEKALKEEIAALKARKRDDAFITGLRDIEEELAFLESISIDLSKLSAATMDVAPTVPWEPVKPRKVLSVVLALMISTLFGVFAALVMHSVRHAGAKTQ